MSPPEAETTRRAYQMVLRWTAAAVLEAVKGFRRLKGHKEIPVVNAAPPINAPGHTILVEIF
jgi:hypothetical protein